MPGNRISVRHVTTNSVIIAILVLFSSPVRCTSLKAHHSRSELEPAAFLITSPSSPVKGSSSKVKSSTRIPPEIYSFTVRSDIKYRYSRTLITSRVANKDPYNGQEVTFSVVLPERAFISKFFMEINGVPYEAYVKEKEQAKMDYAQAQRLGQSSGLIEKSTRNSNIFNVNVNVEPGSKVTFNLTYEELLARKLGLYEQAININPDQVVSIKDYQIVVNIEESQNLSLVRVPSLSNDVDPRNNQTNNPDIIVERPAPNKAKISWTPQSASQRQLAKEKSSLGKFLVQYDIDRRAAVADAGQVLLMQGYFVHYFAPENLPPLRKHVVFILDVSGSMSGRRIEQLKEAQTKILGDLSSDDYFNIITFSSDVTTWSPQSYNKNMPFPATPENVAEAKDFIAMLSVGGGTNIHGALIQALRLIRIITDTSAAGDWAAEVLLPANVHSMIIFLTDGEPTIGITTPSEILKRMQLANQNLHIPIYSLAFGGEADFPFLKRLSLQNNGFARKIYEASDAALQLEGLFAEISSPLLSNVTFNYTSDQYNVSDLTVTRFPAAFSGAEIVVAGKLDISETKPVRRNGETQHSFHFTSKKKHQFETDAGVKTGHNLEQPKSYYLNVNVGGLGRNASVELHRTKFFEQLAPCYAADLTSPSIDITNNSQFSPTSPSIASEDIFLERLWAYLTISQAIENDSSKHPDIHPSWGSFMTSTEKRQRMKTPKEKALRLALRYGFVTSLTSLVVVKPNSIEVTNALPIDGQLDPFDGHSEQIQPFRKSNSAKRRPAGVSSPANLSSHSSIAAVEPLVWNSKPPKQYPVGLESLFGMKVSYSSTGGSYPHSSWKSNLTNVNKNANHSVRNNVSTTSTSRVRASHQTTGRPFLPTQPAAPKKTLGDITWLRKHRYIIWVNGIQYRVATGATFGDNEGYQCTNSRTGLQGRCKHVRNCVLPAFLDDENTFIESFFCGISSSRGRLSKSYAGVCCSSKSRVTRKPSFVSPFSHNFSH